MARGRLGRLVAAAALAGCFWTYGAHAGEAEIVAANATQEAGGTWRFDVTVRHADSGWSHYADAWSVIGPDGLALGTRVLLHPHENEQPFTRSLTGVRVPAIVGRVAIRVHDKVHGWSKRKMTVELRP